MTDQINRRQTESDSPELAIIVPTYNESANINTLVEKIKTALTNVRWQIIFVDDDSPDQTWMIIRRLAEQDDRIRLVHRIGRSGLSSACLEGMLASTSPYIAVMDSDLQHDESLLSQMLDRIRNTNAEIVVASRKMAESDFGDMPPARVLMSNFAAWLADKALKVRLTDPMSGFFMIRRELLDEVSRKLYGKGFKILLDFCVTANRPLAIEELPYRMRARTQGESKLGIQVVAEYLLFLISNGMGRILPVRFLKFCLVGGIGVLVHLLALGILHRGFELPFNYSQWAATYIAMTGNYILNNRFTFGDRKRKGTAWWTGLLGFFAVCTIGAFIGVTVGVFLHDNGLPWWFAGLATTLVAAFWNFSVSLTFTWRKVSNSKEAG